MRAGLLPSRYALVVDLMPSGEFQRRLKEQFDDEEVSKEELDDESNLATEWLVARKYSWHDAFGRGNWHEPGTPVHEYEPLKVPGLHREFAATLPTPERILAFANKYGFLGDDIRSLREPGFEEHRLGFEDGDVFGEDLDSWKQALWHVRKLLTIWDLLRDPKATDDAFYRHVGFDGGLACLRAGGFYDNDHTDDPPAEEWSLWFYPYEYLYAYVPPELDTEGLLRRVARTVLRGVIEDFLSVETRPMVLVGEGGQINLVPKNLLGAIFVQLAHEVVGRTETPARCASCARWFSPKHAARIYCSDACKMKAYRQAKKGKPEVKE